MALFDSTWLQRTFLGDTLLQWLIALGLFLLTLLVFLVLKRWGSRQLRRWTAGTDTKLDDLLIDVLARTRPFFMVLLAAWVASQALDVPSEAASVLRKVALVAVLVQVGLWASASFSGWLDLIRQAKADKKEVLTWLDPVEWAGKAVIWMLLLSVGLENLGVDITGLATGLGIGGVAVALAVQSVLGDLFSSMSIYADRPFVLGDFLVVDEHSGTVEQIGLKTTRLRSLGGEQIVFSNSDLLGSRIRNFGRLVERRISFTVGVTYDTPREQLEAIPAIVRQTVEGQEHARFERCHFRELGDSALQFETVYFVDLPAFDTYLEIQEAINLELMQRFAAQGTEFAFPTQTVILGGAEPPAPGAAGGPGEASADLRPPRQA